MCIWQVFECPDCQHVSPNPNGSTVVCNNPNCIRKELNLHDLSPRDRYNYLEDDLPCYGECPAEYCGTSTRMVLCGRLLSERTHCSNYHSQSLMQDSSEETTVEQKQ
jgi:hypothetical protein